ncbi:hypothetical protein JZ785_10090 [Alicyclobacillus curvatus]|nr:hypothetical protein JZ785_10090 [Alicyclobacillus curvatus]
MTGKAYRMGRLFQQVDGKTVILPVDHGIALGHVKGLRDPLTVLRTLAKVGPDAVLLNPGLDKIASDVLYQGKAPARILTVDNFFFNDAVFVQDRVNWAEQAVIHGYDAIKLLLPWDGTPEERMTSVRLAANFVRESERWQIPVIIEPTLLRTAHTDDDMLSDGVRVAFELGADILKAPLPTSMEVLTEWVQSFRTPIVLLGGPKGGTDEDLLAAVAEAMHIGVKGVAIGRKVWQRPLPEAAAFFDKLIRVVHSEL